MTEHFLIQNPSSGAVGATVPPPAGNAGFDPDKAVSQAFLLSVDMMSDITSARNTLSEVDQAILNISVQHAMSGVASLQKLLSEMGMLARNWSGFQNYCSNEKLYCLLKDMQYQQQHPSAGAAGKYWSDFRQLPLNYQLELEGEPPIIPPESVSAVLKQAFPSGAPQLPGFLSSGEVAQWMEWSKGNTLSNFENTINAKSQQVNTLLVYVQNWKKLADNFENTSEALTNEIPEYAAQLPELLQLLRDVFINN